MNIIPTISFQILGPNEGAAEGSIHGLWFKLHSNPPPTEDLLIALKVRSSNGEVKQSGTIMILKHESHSADFFYKTVLGELDVWIEIEPITSYPKLDFPIYTNEGYVIEEGYKFPEYDIGTLSKIVPYQWNGHDRGLWTDENR
ncbi:MAG: hypothetical protein OXD54_07600 [Candidatus Poribacteria bacterium]|nr:hypothetical protein [Candidatus Poribacteria bacterium]